MHKGHFDIPLSVCKTISDKIGYSLSGSACCEVPESSIKKISKNIFAFKSKGSTVYTILERMCHGFAYIQYQYA